jgi:prepilin-type N-terminal cleavage/methylation domain-containing protein
MSVRNNSAFTLMETLISIVIIAAIVSALYGSYCAAANSINRCQGNIDTTRQAQLLFDTITRQIRTGYTPKADKSESKKCFYGNIADSGGIILQLITTTGIGQTTLYDSPVQATYKYDPADGIIYYYQKKNIYSDSDDQADKQILAEKVASINLSFFDGKKYYQQWPVPDSKPLPQAVKIDVTFDSENQTQPKKFTTIACVSGNRTQ